jgi:mannose-6-phosphate isomerase-like protein (cupin superfamily)
MKQIKSFSLGLFGIVILVSSLYTIQLKEKSRDIEVAEPLKYVSIYTDADSQSHFGEAELTFQLMAYAPPAPPISVSELFNAEGVSFISSPSGWFGDWHPAPHRQFIFILSGELEVEVSDGEIRKFAPGDIILVKDTKGQGHISRVVGNERAYLAVVPLR